MALSLQMVQRLWPTKFAFWPKGWLLPAETGKLESWMRKHPTETVRAGQYRAVVGERAVTDEHRTALRLLANGGTTLETPSKTT